MSTFIIDVSQSTIISLREKVGISQDHRLFGGHQCSAMREQDQNKSRWTLQQHLPSESVLLQQSTAIIQTATENGKVYDHQCNTLSFRRKVLKHLVSIQWASVKIGFFHLSKASPFPDVSHYFQLVVVLMWSSVLCHLHCTSLTLCNNRWRKTT